MDVQKKLDLLKKVEPGFKWAGRICTLVGVPALIYCLVARPEAYWFNICLTAVWSLLGGWALRDYFANRSEAFYVGMVESYSKLVAIMIPVMKKQTEALRQAKEIIDSLGQAAPDTERSKDSFDIHRWH